MVTATATATAVASSLGCGEVAKALYAGDLVKGFARAGRCAQEAAKAVAGPLGRWLKAT